VSALSRRAFLKTAGALVLGAHLPAQGQTGRGEINAWVMVLPNEQVIVYRALGDGAGQHDGERQLVAEEPRVRLEARARR
jgi:hypothetical protein